MNDLIRQIIGLIFEFKHKTSLSSKVDKTSYQKGLLQRQNATVGKVNEKLLDDMPISNKKANVTDDTTLYAEVPEVGMS